MPGMSYLPELLVGGGRGWRSLVQVTVITLSYLSELKDKIDPKAEDITLLQQKVENPSWLKASLLAFSGLESATQAAGGETSMLYSCETYELQYQPARQAVPTGATKAGLLCSQEAQFPAPMWGGSRPPAAPASWDPTPLTLTRTHSQ